MFLTFVTVISSSAQRARIRSAHQRGFKGVWMIDPAAEFEPATHSGTQTFQIPSPPRFALWQRLKDQDNHQSVAATSAADQPGAFSAN
jgi:hypothetical protein